MTTCDSTGSPRPDRARRVRLSPGDSDLAVHDGQGPPEPGRTPKASAQPVGRIVEDRARYNGRACSAASAATTPASTHTEAVGDHRVRRSARVRSPPSSTLRDEPTQRRQPQASRRGRSPATSDDSMTRPRSTCHSGRSWRARAEWWVAVSVVGRERITAITSQAIPDIEIGDRARARASTNAPRRTRASSPDLTHRATSSATHAEPGDLVGADHSSLPDEQSLGHCAIHRLSVSACQATVNRHPARTCGQCQWV